MQTPADAPRPAVTEAPAVSVIMNCLNSSRHLREALDSLMAQTFTDFEVIFWDNASTDASPAIAQSYGPQVRYFRGETIAPLGAAAIWPWPRPGAATWPFWTATTSGGPKNWRRRRPFLRSTPAWALPAPTRKS